MAGANTLKLLSRNATAAAPAAAAADQIWSLMSTAAARCAGLSGSSLGVAVAEGERVY